MVEGAGAAAPRPSVLDRSLRWLLLGCAGWIILLSAVVVAGFLLLAIPLAALVVAGLAAVLLVPAYAALILALDPREPEPAVLLGAAFFWGAFVAVLGSALIELLTDATLAAVLGSGVADILGASLVAPVVEESAKGSALALLFLLARHEFDDVVDGIVYGALVGLGFAMVENVLYFAGAYLEGGLVGVGALFFLRSVLGGLAHSLFTSATGVGLGLYRQAAPGKRRLLWPIAGFVVAILLHALWNGVSTLLQATNLARDNPLLTLGLLLGLPLALTVPGLLTLMVLSVTGGRRAARIIREQLASEVGRGTALPDDLEVLARPWARRRRSWRALRRGGLRAWLLRRQLDELLVDLAFRKWHVARGERLPRFLQAYSEEHYRERIAALRARLEEHGAATGRHPT